MYAKLLEGVRKGLEGFPERDSKKAYPCAEAAICAGIGIPKHPAWTEDEVRHDEPEEVVLARVADALHVTFDPHGPPLTGISPVTGRWTERCLEGIARVFRISVPELEGMRSEFREGKVPTHGR